MDRIRLTERPDWRQKAEAYGFPFHTIGGAVYWDETVAWRFSLREIEEDIEAPTGELEQMCLAFVKEAMKHETILKQLDIPDAYWTFIRESWGRGDRNLYGRFDFAYNGKGPAKLLEYNADTPTSLFEAAVFQWTWLEEQMAASISCCIWPPSRTAWRTAPRWPISRIAPGKAALKRRNSPSATSASTARVCSRTLTMR
jgi:glutathionylspermidine synthase